MKILTKLFGHNYKLRPPLTLVKRPPPGTAAAATAEDDRQKPLRIIHAGGSVEYYYMAIPAVTILNKHPKFVLARPEVFCRPWDSLVRPEEVLMPGEKLYVVPRGTIRKLRKRIRRPSARIPEAVTRESEPETESESDASSRMLTATKGTVTGKPVASVRPQRKVRFVDMWQPSLVSIDESSSPA